VRDTFRHTMDTAAPLPKLSFDTHPSKYRHWTLAVEGDTARLTMKVQPFGGAKTEIELKSNSYDMSVDIELADAVQRLQHLQQGALHGAATEPDPDQSAAAGRTRDGVISGPPPILIGLGTSNRGSRIVPLLRR